MEKKYATDKEKFKKENAKIKIRLQAKEIKQAELSTEHQALQSAFQCLQQDFIRQKETLRPFVKNTTNMPHNEKN